MVNFAIPMGRVAAYGGRMKSVITLASLALVLLLLPSLARADSPACAKVAQRLSKARAAKRPVLDARKVADALTELLEADPACQAAPNAAFDLVIAAWKEVLPPYDKALTREAIAKEMERIRDVTRVLGAISSFEHTGLAGHAALAMGKIQEATGHFLRRQGDRAAPRQPGVDTLYGSGAPNPWRGWMLRARASYERALAVLSDPRDKATHDAAQRLLDTLTKSYLARAAPRPAKAAAEPEPEAEAAAAEQPAAPDEPAPSPTRVWPQPEVTIFTTTWCPHCETARRWLTDNEIRFRELDVEADPKAREVEAKLAKRAGVDPATLKGLPLLFVGAEYHQGAGIAWMTERLFQ